MTGGLLPNDELFEPGRSQARWQVVDPRPRCGRIKLFDCQERQEQYKDLVEINEAVVTGGLVLRRQGAGRVSAAAQNDPQLDERLRRAIRVLARAQALQRRLGCSLARAHDQLKADKLPGTDAALPSRATLYRYAKASRAGLPALRGDKNKGNRTQRYDTKVTRLICDTANTLYLRPGSRWTLHDLTHRVNAAAREFGWVGPRSRISRAFVSKTIALNLSADPEVERMDPRLVSAAKSIAKQRIVVTVPLERVEQDALHLPFVVKTVHGEANNCWVVHAIDCATGMVVGWTLMVGAPSASDGLRCVESMLFPKTAAWKSLGLDYEMAVHGTPHLLVFDNGPEARAERMHRLVRLGVDVMHCRSRAAHGKPYVERLNRALKEALQTLPGCTRMDGVDGRRDPVALGDALMSLPELERWLVRWYYEDWAHRPLMRHLRSDYELPVKLGRTPAERWSRMTGELAFAVPLSPSLSEWRQTLFDHELRTLSRKTGITYRGFNYRGERLPYLIARYGQRQVKVLANPDDFREVFVMDGDDLPLVPLTEEFVDDSTPAYSFKEAEERFKSPPAPAPGAATRQRLREDVQARAIESSGSRPRKKSRAERNKEVADKARADQAVRRAAARPLAAADPLVSSPDAVAPSVSFDDVGPLPVRSRSSGEVRK
jgi:putative transposase